jgi:hypothetical protein
MLNKFKVEYKPVEAPIKSCSFESSGGRKVLIDFDSAHGMRIVFSDTLSPEEMQASFNKSDLGEFIELLQKFHEQM